MSSYRITLEDLKNFSLKKKGSSEESIYFCPYCEHEKGSKDVKGKLYINELVGKGYCFRCNSSLHITKINDQTETKSTDILENSLNLLQDYLKFESSEKENENKKENSFDLSFFKDLEKIHKDYIYSRGFTDYHIQKYNLKSYMSSIVIPSFNKEQKVNYVQLRSVLFKRYENTISEKPIFNLYRSLEENQGTLFITEGIFSAMTIGGCAIYGKSITDYQIKLLSECSRNIDRIVITLDGGFFLDTFKSYSRLKVLNIPIYYCALPYDKDFNDMEAEEIIYSLQNNIFLLEDYKLKILSSRFKMYNKNYKKFYEEVILNCK